MTSAQQVVFDVVARDLASANLARVGQNFGGVADDAQAAARQASGAMDSMLASVRQVSNSVAIEATQVGQGWTAMAQTTQRQLGAATTTVQQQTGQWGNAAQSGMAAMQQAVQQGGTGVTRAVNQSLSQATPAAQQQGQSAGRGFGDAMKGALAAIGVTALFAKLGSIASEAFATGLEQTAQLANTQAALGLSPEDARKLGQKAGELYSQGYGDSIPEMTKQLEAAQATFQLVPGFGPDDYATMAKYANDMSSAFGVESEKTLSSVNTLLNSGLVSNAYEAFDLITAGAQKVPASMRESLLDASDEYSTYFRTIGLSGTDAMNVLVEGSKNGEIGLDKIGDAIKEFTIRSTDMSSATGAFKTIGLDAQTMSNMILAGGDSAKSATRQIAQGLLSIKDPTERSNAAIQFFGSQMEDMNVADVPKFLQSLSGITDHLGDVTGAAQEMDSTVGAGTTGWELFTRTVESKAAAFMTDVLIPALNDVATWLNTMVGPAIDSVASWFTATLVPAIQLAVSWFKENLVPIFSRVWEVATQLWDIIVRVGSAFIDAASGIAMDVWPYLADAFEKIGSFLGETVMPALMSFGEWLADNKGLIGAIAAGLLGWYTAMLAVNTVMGIVTLATKAWAVATGLLNAVMAANPIVLVIAAIAALVAAVVWAYNNVEWFRDLVDNAWDVICDAATWAWENVLKPTFDWIVGAAKNTGEWFTRMWTDYISPAWDAISAAFIWIWENIISPYLGFWWDMVTKVGDVFSWLWDTVSNVWTWISDKIDTAYAWIRDNVFLPAGVAIEVVGGYFTGLWNTVSQVWDWIGEKIQGIWDNVISPIWDSIQDFIKGIGEFFDGIFGGVKDAVEGVKGFITDIVDAIKGFFTKTVEFEPVSAEAMANVSSSTGGYAPGQGPVVGSNPFALPGKATGGEITGHGGPRQDNLLYRLSAGEYVVNANAYSKHAPLVEAINADGLATGGPVGAPAVTKLVTDRLTNILQSRAEQLVQAKANEVAASMQLSGDASAASFAGNGNWGPVNYGGLAENAAAAKAFITKQWGITDIGGWRASGSVAGSDHPSGKALDVMIANYKSAAGIAQGTSVADWFRFNKEAYGSKYVIWRDRIDNLSGRGWEAYNHPSGNDDTLQHRDHVHISFLTGPSGFGTTPIGRAVGESLSTVQGALAGLAGGGGGSGVERWRQTVLQALSLTGQSPSWANAVLNQMNSESSGNPSAINLWDSNATVRGTPSKGLMQVIDPTFRTYAMAGLNSNIYDPLSNIVAAIRYAIATYGGLSVFNKGQAYDNGGIFPSGTFGWNTTGRHEAVLDPDETVAYQSTARALAEGRGVGSTMVQAGAVQIQVMGDVRDPAELQAALEETLRRVLQDQIDRSYVPVRR